MKLLFYLMAFCLLLNTSCKNEINVQLSASMLEAGQVSGKIILPVNTKIDTSGLEVLTGVGAVIPVNVSYAIDTTGKTSATLLMNKAEDVVLNIYNYLRGYAILFEH